MWCVGIIRRGDGCFCRFGLTVRYAMKAAPNAAILRLFDSMGVHIDASSCHEVSRAIAAGIPPAHISLSTQELSSGFAELMAAGVRWRWR